MIKILFKNETVMRQATFSRISENVIMLSGLKDANTSGFTTWRLDVETKLGDFSDYNTVYKLLNDAIQLSNNGSIWAEEEPFKINDNIPTQLDRIEAQALYTALMTDTILEEG